MKQEKERSQRGFREGPFGYHQEVELEISSLTNMGQGVGRVEGWVVMVPFTIPGERVRARVYRNHKNYSDADLMEVLRPSENRVEASCPVFGTCGGCQYQHIEYEEQLRWKGKQVEELFQRMAGIEVKVRSVVGSPRQYGYRSKITPHFQKPRRGEVPAIGFLRQGNRRAIVDVPQCPIASEGINRALPGIRERVLRRIADYKRGATLLIRDAVEGVTTDPKALITERVADLELQFLASDFFQNNPFILGELVRHVVEAAGEGGSRFLIDAYCGSGLFAIAAGRKFERVVGIEISETAVEQAGRNAARNGMENCRFIAGEAASIFQGVAFPPEETSVVIDPPRRGSDEAFLRQLFAYRPRRVVYVSCNPATQIRDLASFTEQGYELESVQPFDLFPQTKHLECVATLRAVR